MAAKLIILSPSGPGREFLLSESDTTSLGRHPNQTVQLLDRLCSKEHAVVGHDGVEWYLQDLDSRNVFRLPRGYCSDTFEVGVEGSVRLRTIRIAETPTGLREV